MCGDASPRDDSRVGDRRTWAASRARLAAPGANASETSNDLEMWHNPEA